MSANDSDARQTAARDFVRNLVVVAGAGTGKTSLLVERILHLVLERGTPIERVAAITFTEKAAAEMRERIEEGLQTATALLRREARRSDAGEEAKRVLERLFSGESGPGGAAGVERERALERADTALASLDDAVITTIHSFTSEILRRHAGTAGVDPEFRVDDGQAADALFEELWNAHLVEIFGGSVEAPESWRSVLKTSSIEDVETIARKLSSFKYADAFLADGALSKSDFSSDPDGEPDNRQGDIARELGSTCVKDVRTLRAELDGVSGLNRRVAGYLDTLEATFTVLEKCDGAVSDAVGNLVGQLPKSKPTLGRNAVVPNARSVAARLERLISTARRLVDVDGALASRLQAALGAFVRRYLEEYLARGWLSFDGMIVLTRNLLRDSPSARSAECSRFDSILVDEFQDNDPQQYEIALYLTASGSPNDTAAGVDAYDLELAPGKLFIVGDPKQSIYRFRGADIGAFNKAVATVVSRGGQCLELTSNFRSVPELVEPLNDLFAGYFSEASAQDPLFSPIRGQRPAAGESRIEIWSVGDKTARASERRRVEGAAIARHIADGVASGDFDYGDAAILLRALPDVGIYLQQLRKRGIPYIVEGGREFYERYEVELLLAFLRAVVNAADSVALVSWLRSPIAGVTDAELQRYATTETSGWSQLAEPDQKDYPLLSAALDVLREFARRHRGAPIDELARAALAETPLRLAMAVSYEGAQRVVNLDKAVRRIAELAADGRRSPEEVLNHLEQVEAFERSEGDSPLADETVDAVRVLSIHSAKGLEWPIVFVADVARDGESSPSDSLELEVTRGRRGALTPALALRVNGSLTPAYVSYWLDRREHEGAESKRLLYVAATRARERLILIAGAPRRSLERTWLRPLGAWGYHLDDGFPQVADFSGGRVIHRRVEAVRECRPPKFRDELTPGLLDGVKRFHDARSSAGSAAQEWLRSPSGLRERSPGMVDDDSPRSTDGVATQNNRLPQDQGRDASATAIGTAVHLLLEVWDRRDVEWLLKNADRAARVAAASEGADAASVEDQVRSVLQAARRDGVLERLAKAEVVAQELPVLYRDDDGTVWHGSVDLVTGSASSPEIVDYKTSRGRTVEQLEAEHAPQLNCYQEALRRALGLTSSPPARIEALITQHPVGPAGGAAETEQNAGQ